MYRYKIELDTMRDIQNFVGIVSALPGKITLEDGSEGFKINAKSLLGAVLAVQEWDSLLCVAETDIFRSIQCFIKE